MAFGEVPPWEGRSWYICLPDRVWTETHLASIRSSSEDEETFSSIAMDSLVVANTKFCLDLFREFSKDDDHKNIFFCPLSLSAALGMIRLGARNGSARQVDEVLHFNELSLNESEEPDPCRQSKRLPDSPSGEQRPTAGSLDAQAELSGDGNNANQLLSCYFGKLLSRLDRIKDYYTLSVANRLYAEQGFPIRPEYIDGVTQFYHTTIESTDFRGDTEKSRQMINFWVESQCQGKIKELFSKDTITDSTVLLLVNAVYFKAKWEKHFDLEDTVDAPFILNENEQKSVKMMNQRGLFRIGFIEELQAHILEMKYTMGKLSMFILLPPSSADNVKGLRELEKKISYEKIMAWSSSENMSEGTVAVSLPQFTLEDSYDLNSVLQDMGITDIFDETKADLTGISPSPSLHLSKIIHKTFVEVDESGTQATAASGAVGMEKSLAPGVEFNVNQPFLFFIQHNKTKSILLFGRVVSL